MALGTCCLVDKWWLMLSRWLPLSQPLLSRLLNTLLSRRHTVVLAWLGHASEVFGAVFAWWLLPYFVALWECRQTPST